MSAEPDISRRCKDCADTTHTVCCFVFGKYWRNKSRNGHGCSHPLDDVADAWAKDGWKPGDAPRAKLELPMDEKKQKAVMQAAKLQQGNLFSPNEKPAEPPPLSDEDY